MNLAASTFNVSGEKLNHFENNTQISYILKQKSRP